VSHISGSGVGGGVGPGLGEGVGGAGGGGGGLGSSLHWVGWLHGNATLSRSITLMATGQTDVAFVAPLVCPAYMVICISSKPNHHIVLAGKRLTQPHQEFLTIQ